MRHELQQKGTVFREHPPAKDETDLELALCWIAERSDVDQIVILGGLGGRPDQTLANLLLLAMPALEGVDALFADGGWTVRLIRPEQRFRL